MTDCARCGGPFDHEHHPAGRVNGAHYVADWTVPLCAACHGDEHAERSVLGLDRLPCRLHVLDVVEVVCRRVAVTIDRLGSNPALRVFSDGLTRFLVRIADDIAGVIHALDRLLPSWRSEILEVTP